MKYMTFLIFLGCCAHPPSNEMEEMSKDVLKSHQGIEIQVFPLSKDDQ
jgi:hypothetical protein